MEKHRAYIHYLIVWVKFEIAVYKYRHAVARLNKWRREQDNTLSDI